MNSRENNIISWIDQWLVFGRINAKFFYCSVVYGMLFSLGYNYYMTMKTSFFKRTGLTNLLIFTLGAAMIIGLSGALTICWTKVGCNALHPYIVWIPVSYCFCRKIYLKSVYNGIYWFMGHIQPWPKLLLEVIFLILLNHEASNETREHQIFIVWLKHKRNINKYKISHKKYKIRQFFPKYEYLQCWPITKNVFYSLRHSRDQILNDVYINTVAFMQNQAMQVSL